MCQRSATSQYHALTSLSFSTSRDQKLIDFRIGVLRKLRAFNDDSIPDDCTLATLKSRRMDMAKTMLGKIGQNVNIEQPFNVTIGCTLFIGDNVYMNRE